VQGKLLYVYDSFNRKRVSMYTVDLYTSLDVINSSDIAYRTL